MKPISFILAVLVALGAAACRPKESEPSGGKNKSDVPVVEDQEFALGREWVETMLEEDRKAMARMRDQLDAVRREVERLDSTGNGESSEADAARARLRELLDEQDRELRKFRERAADMRKVMGEDVPKS